MAVTKDIFCLDSGATAQCELFLLCRLEITLLTYCLASAGTQCAYSHVGCQAK